MKCTNCKEPIISPIEHEFCAFVPDKRPILKNAPIASGNQPPHRPKKWQMPVQKPISKHKLAPPISRPPLQVKSVNLDKEDFVIDNTRSDTARKILEEIG